MLKIVIILLLLWIGIMILVLTVARRLKKKNNLMDAIHPSSLNSIAEKETSYRGKPAVNEYVNFYVNIEDVVSEEKLN